MSRLKGYKHTEETKRKISKINKGRKHTEESRKNMSKAQKGRPKPKNAYSFPKGHIMSNETKKKISEALKGHKHSEETKKKISEASKGNKNCLGYKFSEEQKRKMGETRKGKKLFLSEEARKKMSESRKGKKYVLGYRHTIETKKKMSENRRGAKNGFWRGGITPENLRIRHSIEIRLWREMVFARDGWTCQECSQHGGKLNAHHIKSFSKHIELRTSIENGITLCRKCHIGFHTKKNG